MLQKNIARRKENATKKYFLSFHLIPKIIGH